MDQFDDVVIGAGPAGCAAAAVLSEAGRRVLILERLSQPGGLARTIVRDGNRFDIGPHHFFTKSEEVLGLWRRFIGPDLLSVDRLTRIFYRGRLIRYPLSPIDALMGLGPARAAAAVFSYVGRKVTRLVRPREPQSFEEWVADQFGVVLYRAFFKTYTEKVWGIPCAKMSAEWAAQRIKGLSLAKAILNALSGGRISKVRTLADRFLYPRLGAGQFCENVVQSVLDHGGQVRYNAEVCGVGAEQGRARTVIYRDAGGASRQVEAEHIICSAPLTHLVRFLSPAPPGGVLRAAESLRYRGHVSVNLLVDELLSPDNWIYVHSPRVRLGRIANYRNFSRAMCSEDNVSPITVEYFVFRGDEVESLGDDALCDLAVRELRRVNLLPESAQVRDSFVVREHHAYPLLERGGEQKVETIRAYLETVPNLWPMGRAGLFKYNNQDHAVVTGLLAARNVLGEDNDIWSVNIDAEYHGSGVALDPAGNDNAGA